MNGTLCLRMSDVARLISIAQAIHDEVRDYPDKPPCSTESWLPPHMVEQLGNALRLIDRAPLEVVKP